MKKFLTVAISVVCLLATTACGGAKTNYIDYATGFDDLGHYNSDLFFYNRNQTLGADPGFIFVPESRDATYGGYYYAYTTGGTHNVSVDYAEQADSLEIPCFRSKDMCSWESCGALVGNALLLVDDDWDDITGSVLACAPEVYYDSTEELYYMFYSREAKRDRLEDNDVYDNTVSRCRIGIATSKSPVGPFTSVYDTDPETGKRIPCIDVARELDYPGYSLIDPHVFIDGDEKYLIANHQNDATALSNGIFAMKMTSWTTVDYDTFTCLTVPDYITVNKYTGRAVLEHDADLIIGNPIYQSEGTVNEGGYMMKHNGKYYLTYSAFGYSAQMYSVHQAVADSPLGNFKKLAPVLDGSAINYAKGTGHHAFVEEGGETFIFYHKHGNSEKYDGARYLAIDRCVWTKKADGEEILTANGPSKCLQWLPESISGYQNLAAEATVTVSKGVSGAEYLTDGILPFYNYNLNSFMTSSDGATITLTFNAPVSVSAVMVYNSDNIFSAFSKIKAITFDYAEETDGYKKGAVTDLEFPSRYYNAYDETIYNCSPAVAIIDEIKVTAVTIEIDSGDLLMEYDQTGAPNKDLKLSEIVVLGRKG